MRIASWNIRRSSKALQFAFDELDLQVLMTQESSIRNPESLYAVGDYVDERWVKHRWGNFTYSTVPITNFSYPSEYRGSLHVSRLESQIGTIGLVNIYGLFERVHPDSRKKLATAGLHRKMSDLSPVFWKRIAHDFDHFVVMGDLNHDRRMDSNKSFRRADSEVYSGVFKRLEDFGLVDLLNRDYPEGVQTYRPVRGKYPWQLDHAFVSKGLASHCSVQVVDSPAIHEISDHNPVVLSF